MKNLFYFFVIALTVISCGTINTTSSKKDMEEAVVISNDSLEYEIIILDVGFNTYLQTIAKPIEFYSQNYLETKNNFYVVEWNTRANNPIQYGDLYSDRIEYSSTVDYGLEVNYKLFNYFQFFERKYRVRLR